MEGDVMSARSPYQDTGVATERSKQQISDALRAAGASGVQYEEVWKPEPQIIVRFLWAMGEAPESPVVRVRLMAKPLPPTKTRRVGSTWQGQTVTAEQRERQAWRALAWYLKTMLEAATFGLLRFEDVFLSFVEDENGRTIGEVVIPQLEAGRLMLPKGAS
jgi:hypothetical protein